MDPLVIIVAVGAGVAGFVQGLSGFAFSLVALTFWAWAVPPHLAGPLAVFGSFLGQLLAAGTIRKGFDLRKTVPFVLGGAVGVPIGTAILPHVDQTIFKAAVGALLVIWAPAMLAAARMPRITAGGRAADAAVGAGGGVLGGLAGMTGALPALWCILRAWPRDTQRSVLQAFNLCMHVLTLSAYLAGGLITARAASLFLVVAPAMLVPTLLGARLYRFISDLAFRRLVLALLAISGLVLLGSALRHWMA